MSEQAHDSQVRIVCASHSPLLYCYARKPDQYDEIEAAVETLKLEIEAFDPELVVMFGSDHFNGFFMNLMPAFCVGLAAAAAGDIGGFAGRLDVPSETALALVEHTRAGGVDVAVSYEMGVDHAFSQTIVRLLGGLDARPIVPLFVNCITKPFVPFARTIALGEQVGRFVSSLDQRVLLVASGGMSHNPLRYYPHFGTGGDDVTDWQLHGATESQPGFTEPAWLDRLEVMHIEGAQMLVDGSRTRADIKLSPESDHEFLSHLLPLELEAFTGWDPDALVERAGIGSMELQTWIGAAAAFRAAGGSALTLDVYAETLEYGIATGIVHG
jgi:2,3-dihydroxyphenylpropionate 1,2-dioxygenase